MFDFLPQQPVAADEASAISEKVWKSIKAILQKTPLPKTFYHYTDAAGLKGIVESGSLRATHIAFMNDASEYLHAISLLTDSIRAARTRPLSVLQIKLLDEIEEPVALTLPQNSAPYFVTCFSSAENSLNQWRAYGRGEGGFCIGFDAAQLNARSNDGYFFISPAIYDPNEQAQWVSEFLDWALAEYPKIATNHIEDEEDHRKRWAHTLLWLATAAAPIMKNPSFAEEQEWRLIHILQSKWDVRFLPKLTGLVPYVELKLGAPQSTSSSDQEHRLGKPLPDKIPITVLWSGPGRATDVSLLAGRTLLEQLNYDGVRLESSKIPFRVG
ncbi:DUF2971 domain-containing protein [Tardiphaga sp. 709]|uniref:DUF2971 domain-containing protein n=1 Tax=Tardiphaga sp. 709 TaxID=3076039 RepID=UPI0028ED9688|nr:DUF2971 domain-containing protein [Tardiphaga sp. 709]WNV09779.1 DUF2971 domain-containing protein [Tardiphaga sp. 709]